MKVIRKILGSRKWLTALASILGLALADFAGINLDGDTLIAIVAIIATIIGGESIADAAGARRRNTL